MNLLEKLTAAIVLSSSVMLPSYADAQQVRQNVQAPVRYYYCSRCGSYHRYSNQNPQNTQSKSRKPRSSGRLFEDIASGVQIAAGQAMGSSGVSVPSFKEGDLEFLNSVLAIIDLLPKDTSDSNSPYNSSPKK